MTTKAKKSAAESMEGLTEATEKVVEAVAETSRETFETMAKAGSGAFADAYEKATKFMDKVKKAGSRYPHIPCSARVHCLHCTTQRQAVFRIYDKPRTHHTICGAGQDTAYCAACTMHAAQDKELLQLGGGC